MAAATAGESPQAAAAAADVEASIEAHATSAIATSASATSADAIVTQSDVISSTTAIGGTNRDGVAADVARSGEGRGDAVALTVGERGGGVVLNTKQPRRSQGEPSVEGRADEVGEKVEGEAVGTGGVCGPHTVGVRGKDEFRDG